MENEKLKEDLIEALTVLTRTWNVTMPIDRRYDAEQVLIKHGLLNANNWAKYPESDDWPANLMVFKK